MDFVTSRELRVTPGPVFEKLQHDRELVITLRGKPVALLVRVDSDDFEDTLRAVRRARAEIAVSRLRREAQEGGRGGMSPEEIEAEISAARTERGPR